MKMDFHAGQTKPMKIEEYNAIVEDFTKLSSFTRKMENELKRKYCQ